MKKKISKTIILQDTNFDPSFYQQVDDFIRETSTAITVKEVQNSLRFHIEELGFEKFSYQVIESPTGKPKDYYISTYPSDWVYRYNEQKYVSFDPRGRYAMTKLCPFTWSEADNALPFTPLQKKIVNEGAEFGVKSGAIVPIHGPTNLRALLAVTSNMSELDFNKMFAQRKHVLQLITHYAHEKLIQLGFHRESPTRICLSPRETEVLTWAARGYTADETGEKISISGETVKTYLKSAIIKLNATNKAQAISVALCCGLIIP